LFIAIHLMAMSKNAEANSLSRIGFASDSPKLFGVEKNPTTRRP
jgi:hypothetical protein